MPAAGRDARVKTDNLRINQLSDDAYRWYQHYLAALDAKDVDAYGQFLADDVTLQMNNDEPVRGQRDVLQGLAAYWQTFGALEHDLLNIYGTDDAFVLEALNHYRTSDGRPVTLRAVAFTDRNPAGKATSVRLYTDTSALFTPSA